MNNDFKLVRFKDKLDLKKLLNVFFNTMNLKVKAIDDKSYYDNDFEDWNIVLTVGNDNEDLYDITIYYCDTRCKEHIIVETYWEEV